MKKLITLIVGLLFCTTAFGQMTTVAPDHVTGSRTVNGIFIKTIETNTIKGISAEIFTDYVTATTTVVYNESGSTTSGMGTMTPGMIDTSDVLDKASLMIKAGNFTNGAATLTVHLNQFIGTTSVYGTQTFNYGTGSYPLPIVEYSEFISIGIAPDTGSITTSIFYNGVTRKIP